MTAATLCRANDPLTCDDPDCPQKLGLNRQLNAAAAGKDFDAFLRAAETAKPTFEAVKLPADFRKVVKDRWPGVTLSLSGDGRNGDFVTLSVIKIPESERGQGVASTIMGELIAAADRNGWNMALTPASDWGSSKPRLEVFYKRFGFVKNAGRRRDFATKEAMIRYA